MEYGGSATFGLRMARDQKPYLHPTSRSNGPESQTMSQSEQEQDIRSIDEKRDCSLEGSSFRLGKGGGG